MTSAIATPAALADRSAAPSLFGRIVSFFTALAAVHRVKIAIEARREPLAADLELLGIDPAQMPRLHGARV